MKMKCPHIDTDCYKKNNGVCPDMANKKCEMVIPKKRKHYKEVTCTYCDGGGEIPTRWTLEGPTMEGCPCCHGEGVISKEKHNRFLKACAEETE